MQLSDISTKFTQETVDAIVCRSGGVKSTAWRFVGGFKKGDSYLSQVFRLQIDGQRENGEKFQVNTVIKSIPNNVGRRKTFRSDDFFRNEINFYEHVMKRCLQHQKQAAKVPENEFFDALPTCLASFSDGIADFIVLEDLGQYGFGTVSRQTGMDLRHCTFAMQLLGRFHAVSFAFRYQQPKEFQETLQFVEETYYADKFFNWYKNLQKDQIAISLDALAKEYPGTEIEAKGKAFITDNLYAKLVSMTHSTNEYSVICHGDCWTPNFLFKYGEDPTIPVCAKMIDFQLSRYASPALDISFFIYSCTTQELREKHYEDLLQAYHAGMTEQLRVVGLQAKEVFPYEALLEEMQQRACFGVGMGIESIPFSVLEDDEAGDMDAIEGDEAVDVTTVWILKPIKNKEGRQRLADMFKHAVQMGYI
ncbi:uncharacterized protein LOC134834102 [Culicoides brevitarsis]|uniref:uncharacterized protein LOC134834102 n=1 Tax=Culicoides brevitarsis TaxID=469753 RepID=UPI00307B20B3